MIRAGKKCAIVAHVKCSMGMIFLEKDMDYYLYSTWEEVNAKGAELSIENATDGMTAPFHAGAAKYFKEKGVEVEVG